MLTSSRSENEFGVDSGPNEVPVNFMFVSPLLT